MRTLLPAHRGAALLLCACHQPHTVATCDGGILESSDDIDGLASCSIVIGDLTVDVDGSLPSLVEVDGALIIPSSRSVELPALRAVNSMMIGEDAAAALPKLATVAETAVLAAPVELPTLRRAGALVLRGQGVDSGLESMQSVGSLMLQDSNAAEFRMPGHVQSLSVYDLSWLRQLSLPDARLASAQLQAADRLTELDVGFAPHVTRLSLSLTGLQQVEALADIETAGSLVLQGTFDHIHLDRLTQVDDLQIGGVTTLRVPVLEYAGSVGINMFSGPTLDLAHVQIGDLRLSAPDDAEPLTLHVGGLQNLTWSARETPLHLPGLTSLHSLSASTTTNLPMTVEAPDLRAAASVTGFGMVQLELPALEQADSVDLSSASLYAPHLSRVGHLRLYGSPLRHLRGFRLEQLDILHLERNPNLVDLPALAGSSPTRLVSYSTPIRSLPKLDATHMDQLVLSDTRLETLDGLARLQTAGEVQITYNSSLKHIGLDRLYRVDGMLDVSDNHSLCSSEVNAWMEDIIAGSRRRVGNDDC